MELFSLIVSLVAELAKLARVLLADGMRFLALLARSRTALAAENLFLRKQLAFYQERKIRPRRFDNVTRFMLVLLSHGFAWQDALSNVTPKTFIGWHRALILALEVTARAAMDTGRITRTHPRNGARQSVLGRGAHCQ